MSLLQEWVDALESGEYRQGREALHNDQYYDENIGEFGEYVDGDNYCCLGVLQDLVNKKRGKNKPVLRQQDYEEMLWPVDFAELFDLRRTQEVKKKKIYIDPPDPFNGRIEDCYQDNKYVQGYLAHLNDGKELSFKEIARWIKRNLKDRT